MGLEMILAPTRYLTGRHTISLHGQMFLYRVISRKTDILRIAVMIVGK